MQRGSRKAANGYRKRANRDAYQQAMILFFQEHLVETD
jgi:hypothetical protein